MQTFLTDVSFIISARNLDSRRLNKQRVEAFQIYNAATGFRHDSLTGEILGEAKGWQNHPAVKMWRGFPDILSEYGLAISRECDRRGIADHRKLGTFFLEHAWYVDLPDWMEDPTYSSIIHSHRCNLIRKDPIHYAPLWPHIDPAIAVTTPYVWPV